MRTTRRASLLIFCISILVLLGACSAGGGSVASPTNQPDLSNYASSVEGVVHQNGAPLTSGHVYIYDLNTYKLFNEAEIGADGEFLAGIDEGQYLAFAFNRTGWQAPMLEGDFSNYINVENDLEYRLDIELTNNIPDGYNLVFGFVTSTENNLPVGGATVEAGGSTTTTDGYGFYAMTVPEGTGDFHISAQGFYELNQNIRNAQATGEYFETPFFNLNPMGATGASIGGVCRDVYDGTGLGGVRVTLRMMSDVNFGPVQYLTNLGGEYRFFNLPEGIYRLYFERPGYVSGARNEIVVNENDDVIVNVFMNFDNTGSAQVSGYVNSAGTSFPVSGARVTVSNPLLGSYLTITNPIGFYYLENIVPADYTVTVVAPGEGVTFYEAMSSYQTIVAGANNLNFALRFLDEGVLRGEVSIVGGGSGFYAYPPTGVEVIAEKVGGLMSGVQWKTNSNGQGYFTFNGLPQGVYKVEGRVEFSTSEIFYGIMEDVVVNPGTTTNLDLALTQN